MERVMGIGGVFFRAKDKLALARWYRDNLGVAIDESWCGAVFPWKANDPKGDAHTVFSPFAHDSDYFKPSTKDFMLNFRVRDLQAMLRQLRDNGCAVDDKVEESEFGKFGWVMDPEGHRIELWEPPPSPPGTLTPRRQGKAPLGMLVPARSPACLAKAL